MSAFKFSGDEKEHITLPHYGATDETRNKKYATIDFPYSPNEYSGLIYSSESDMVVYVHFNRAIGSHMDYILSKFKTIIFSKAGFLKGDNLLYKGASYIIENFSEFEDKNNFIKNLKQDRVSVKTLLGDLVKAGVLYTQFLIDNNILTIEDCYNILKLELDIESNLLISNKFNSYSDKEKEEFNNSLNTKEELDLGVKGYSIEEFNKVYDCSIEDNKILIKKPKIVEETVFFPVINGITDYSINSQPSNKVIKKIYFEEGIKNIYTNAKVVFSKYSSLEEIYLPKSLEHIDDVILDTLPKKVKVYSDNTASDYAVVNKKLVYFNIGREETKINIPEGVEYIKDALFADRPKTKEVTFPSTIKNTGKRTFQNCKVSTVIFTPLLNEIIIDDSTFGACGVMKFEIPKGTKHLGMNAFAYNRAKKIVVPEGVESLANGALMQSEKATSIILPESLKAIGDECFAFSYSLKSIFIPKNVESIGLGVFTKCSSLEQIEVDEDNKFFTSVDGVLYSKDCTRLVSVPLNKEMEEFTILDGVTNIEKEAFRSLNCKTVHIPSSVVSIEEQAFMSSKIISINIPESVKTIESNAFCSCKELIYVKLPNLKKIPEGMFYYCTSLVNITLPTSITEIGEGAFLDCENLENINIPNVEIIPECLFMRCRKLKNTTIPKSVKIIKYDAFFGCDSLTEIIIPEGVEIIGQTAFYGCDNVSKIMLSSTVHTIERGAFDYCKLVKDIFIPKNVINLGYDALELSSQTTIRIEHKEKPDTWADKFHGYVDKSSIKWGQTK